MEGLKDVRVEAAIGGRCEGKGAIHAVNGKDEVVMAMTNDAEAPTKVEVMFTSTVILLFVFLYLYLHWCFCLIRHDHHHLVFAIDGVGDTLASCRYRVAPFYICVDVDANAKWRRGRSVRGGARIDTIARE